MSQSYRTIHEFESLTVAQQALQITPAGTSVTLGNAHSGDVILLNATSGSALVLPALQAGLDYKCIVSATGAHTITAPGQLVFGNLTNAVFNTGANLTCGASGKTTISTTAGSTVGDRLNITCDGTNYYLSGVVANYNAVKFS